MLSYAIQQIDGLRASSRRSVVFLTSPNDPDVDAAKKFAGLDQSRDREVRNRFDYWIDGFRNIRWFHGFDIEPYRECFVFKFKEKNQGHRLYGFLCHPQPKTKPDFELCVLTNHAQKPRAQWETDPSELGFANSMRSNRYVIGAIQMTYSDEPPGKKWTAN